jgi:hypothetical protein
MTHTMHIVAAAACVSRTFAGGFAAFGRTFGLQKALKRGLLVEAITEGDLAAERRDGSTPSHTVGYRPTSQHSAQTPRLPAPSVALVLTQPLNWRPSMSFPAVVVP